MSPIDEYEICKQRGHRAQFSGGVMVRHRDDNRWRAHWLQCDKCGTQWRYESRLVERHVPGRLQP